jgi:hypothetical protein
MEQEEWKSIDGFSRYQVSNLGRVKSLERTTPAGNRGAMRHRPEFIMKGCNFGYEYFKVNMRGDDGKTYNVKVHRLVALHFIPNPHNKPCVNHIDFNRCNNHVNNLEWVTYKENSEHMKQAGRGRGRYSKPKESK